MKRLENIINYTFQDSICFGNKPTNITFLRLFSRRDVGAAIPLYRLSQYLLNRSNNKRLILNKILLGGVMRKYKNITDGFALCLEPKTRIGEGVFFPHNFTVVINSDAQIGKYCIIHPCVLIGRDRGKNGAPIIGDNVFIGHGSKIIGNPIIGDYVFISPASVITKDIPSGSLVGAGVNNILSATGKEHVLLYKRTVKKCP